jgi:outer membrane receptor for ferrienterochelin and colicins
VKMRLLVAAGALALASRTAAAEVATEAAFFDAIARRAYQAGQYNLALESFQLALEIAPSPRLLYNIALCADLAERREMAFSLYQEYLQSMDADTVRRAEAQARSQRLQAVLALVDVRSEPAGAVVYVERKELGELGVTPTTIAVAAGEHRLIIEQPGFVPAVVPVIAELGSRVPVRVSLRPLLGKLSLQVTPAAATLELSRDEAAPAALAVQGSQELPVGTYRVRATAPGYQPAQSSVLVQEAGEARLELRLVPVPRAVGKLLVSTGALAAEVFIDGQRVAVTPAALEAVTVGEHTLEVRAQQVAPAGAPRVVRQTFAIEAGRATYVEIDLGRPTP